MSERAPYSRVYWTVRSDPRLIDIYNDDHHWAAWNRLLLAADMAWPAPADLPGSVRKSSLTALVTAGVIELLPGGLFRFHGLDTERGRRKVAATRLGLGLDPNGDPTGDQAEPKPDPVGFHTQGLSRDELSRAKPSRAETREMPPIGEDGRPDIEAFLAVRFRIPTTAQRSFMDAYVQTFDLTGPQRAAGLILSHPDDPIGALKADLTAFRQERIAAAKQVERPAPVRKRKPTPMTPVNEEMARFFAMKAAEDEEVREHALGDHATSHLGCPSCQGAA